MNNMWNVGALLFFAGAAAVGLSFAFFGPIYPIRLLGIAALAAAGCGIALHAASLVRSGKNPFARWRVGLARRHAAMQISSSADVPQPFLPAH